MLIFDEVWLQRFLLPAELVLVDFELRPFCQCTAVLAFLFVVRINFNQ